MIDIKNISYQLNKKKILDNISLTVEPGEFRLIIGPNGAGKTTLLKIMSGIIRDFDGYAALQGKDIKHISFKESAQILSYQPQFDEFALPIRVKEILMAGRYPYKSFFKNYTDQDQVIFDRIVREMDLEPFLERDISTLSGGERKKVMLASAFIQDVSIILFDEPFTFLDPEAVANLRNLMLTMNRMGKTLVVVSHNFEILFPIVTKLTALKAGKLIYSGDKVFDKAMLKETYNTFFQRILHEGKEILFLDE